MVFIEGMKNTRICICLLSIFLIVTALLSPALSAEATGSLSILTDLATLRIYIDGNYEGNGSLTKGNMTPGNHNIAVKKAGGIIIFDNAVKVKKDFLTTVVITADSYGKAQITSSDIERSKSVNIRSLQLKKDEPSGWESPVGIEADYGTYVMSYRIPGSDHVYMLNALFNAYGYGAFVKLAGTDKNQTVLGYHVSSYKDTLKVSYVYLDFRAKTERFVGSAGINYTAWQCIAIDDPVGGLGGQISLGYRLTDNISLGVKLVLFSFEGTPNPDYLFLFYTSDRIKFTSTQMFCTVTID